MHELRSALYAWFKDTRTFPLAGERHLASKAIVFVTELTALNNRRPSRTAL
jgi:hypothetical protein